MFRRSLFVLALVVATPLLGQAKVQVRSVSRAQVIANAELDFAKVDRDKDGHMSRAEIENFQNANNLTRITASNAAAFTQLDSDRNGQISATEFAKLNPVPKADATAALRIDTNKDDKISRVEHRAATIDKFNQLDGNRDGSLTAEEVRSAAGIPRN